MQRPRGPGRLRPAREGIPLAGVRPGHARNERPGGVRGHPGPGAGCQGPVPERVHPRHPAFRDACPRAGPLPQQACRPGRPPG